MEKTNKERLMAIFIGGIMILSMAGFAMNSTVFTNPQQSTIQIPHIVERPLKPEEVVYVLRTGRVLIRNYYHEEKDYFNTLKNFADKFKDFLVLESVKIDTNETERFELIGMKGNRIGEIKDLSNFSVTYTSLLNVFCEYAILQPKECILTTI